VSDRDVTHSDLVEIAKCNGDFRRNYGDSLRAGVRSVAPSLTCRSRISPWSGRNYASFVLSEFAASRARFHKSERRASTATLIRFNVNVMALEPAGPLDRSVELTWPKSTPHCCRHS
jgi:hypothetical protein